MFAFREFIQEDFNSNGAKQFTLAVNSSNRTSYVPIFYEKIPQKAFNLPRYLKSFDSSVAKETLSKGGGYRGMVFCIPPNYLIFVFTVNQLHSYVAKALDSNVKSNLYPKNSYTKIYISTDNLAASKDPVPEQWCFPFTYSSTGDIQTNLGDNALVKLFRDKKLESEFMLDTSHSVIRDLRRISKD